MTSNYWLVNSKKLALCRLPVILFCVGSIDFRRFQNTISIVSNHHISEAGKKWNFGIIDSYKEMGAATFDFKWLKIGRGTRQLWGKNTKTVQKKRVRIIRYELLKFFPWQVPVREFDICNDFNEGLHGVKFIECSSYQESTVFTNLIFSLCCHQLW